MVMLIAINLIVFIFVFKSKKVNRPLGFFMVAAYTAYMIYAIIR